MVGGLRSRVRRLLGRTASANVQAFTPIVADAGAREAHLRTLDDAELRAAADELRRGTAPFGPADLAQLCALGREAARRALGERAFDVQLVGTLALLAGHVAQMATGEGKTLSGAIAAAGYALQGRRVHVASVNDYLARRDAHWMGPVLDALGVTSGWVDQNSTADQRRDAYAAQVTYAPVSELGFDVLRDRFATGTGDIVVAAEPDVVIVDEADSVLIDEARVPLVLAGAAPAPGADVGITEIVSRLRSGAHYIVDDDHHSVSLTTDGTHRVERELGGVDLYTEEHAATLAQVNVALHARALLHRDVDYIVKDGRVQLINSARGRVAHLQRWPDGLQAAVEAKESLPASETGEVLDSVTVQELIRRYPTVCGMTGTAVAVAERLREFYCLEVAVVDPNVPCVRTDEPDRAYESAADKYAAVVAEVAAAHATGRPVLIGTQDVAESERLARRLAAAGVDAEVLNAKNDAHEATIVAEAGAYGAVTVSTQMAGRGTDIRLGGADGVGHDHVAELGGLLVVLCGRHASSRLDDQLRGRSGRQGDPGGSVALFSLTDDLITRNVPDAPQLAGDDDGRVTDAEAVALAGHAQRVAEGVDARVHRATWQYNELVEQQRRIVLGHRDRVLRTDAAADHLTAARQDRWAKLAADVDADVLAAACRQLTLYHLDRAWTDHLAYLTDLREGIHLRALGRGIDPVAEYNRAAIAAFDDLLPAAQRAAGDAFDTATITADGLDADTSGMRRPSATWTYMVHDNPFGSQTERALRGIGALLKR